MLHCVMYSVQLALCSAHGVQVHGVQQAVCAVCAVQYVHLMQCEVCSVQPTLCSVQCAGCAGCNAAGLAEAAPHSTSIVSLCRHNPINQ